MVVEHGCSLVRVQLPRGSPGGDQGVSAGPGRQVQSCQKATQPTVGNLREAF